MQCGGRKVFCALFPCGLCLNKATPRAPFPMQVQGPNSPWPEDPQFQQTQVAAEGAQHF